MVPDEISHLAAEVLQLCRVGGLKMAMAESCTGGLITGCLTAVAGASDVIERGFIVYRNQAKTEMLGVPAALIATHNSDLAARMNRVLALRDGAVVEG